MFINVKIIAFNKIYNVNITSICYSLITDLAISDNLVSKYLFYNQKK